MLHTPVPFDDTFNVGAGGLHSASADPIDLKIEALGCQRLGHLLQVLPRLIDGFDPQRIIYPCSGKDPSVYKAFPDREVHYVDANPDVLQLTKEGFSGLHVRLGNVEDFRQLLLSSDDRYDLMVLHNALGNTSESYRAVREGGYVVANNQYNSDAGITFRHPHFRLVGVLQKGMYYTSGLEQFIEEWHSGIREEASWSIKGGTTCDEIRAIVREITHAGNSLGSGTSLAEKPEHGEETSQPEDWVNLYRHYVSEACTQNSVEASRAYPWRHRSSITYTSPDGKQFTLPLNIPVKLTGDLFVFKKIDEFPWRRRRT